jgi:hypothetical protein
VTKSNFLNAAPRGVNLSLVVRSYLFLDALNRIENVGPRDVAIGYWEAFNSCYNKGWNIQEGDFNRS